MTQYFWIVPAICYLIANVISAILLFVVYEFNCQAWGFLNISLTLSLVPTLGLLLYYIDKNIYLNIIFYIISVVCILCLLFSVLFFLLIYIEDGKSITELMGLAVLIIPFIVAFFIKNESGHYFILTSFIGGYLFQHFLIWFGYQMELRGF